jgi:TetR/AcrR family transcriptional repressor of nem operon
LQLVTIVIIVNDNHNHQGLRNMRVSKEQAADNRQKILGAAATLMRERGISGVGVDALTEAAGLTHGSVYSQFGSKDRLAAEALRHIFAKNAEGLEHAQDISSYITHYLSLRHRDAPGKGCALAALGCEMPRSSEAVRSSFTEGLRGVLEHIARLVGNGPKRSKNEAAVTLATMVGSLVLARAVDDAELAEQILDAARKSLLAQV